MPAKLSENAGLSKTRGGCPFFGGVSSLVMVLFALQWYVVSEEVKKRNVLVSMIYDLLKTDMKPKHIISGIQPLVFGRVKL